MKKAIAFMLIFATLLITSSCDSAFVDESSVDISISNKKVDNDKEDNSGDTASENTPKKEESNDTENSVPIPNDPENDNDNDNCVKIGYETWEKCVDIAAKKGIKDLPEFNKLFEILNPSYFSPYKLIEHYYDEYHLVINASTGSRGATIEIFRLDEEQQKMDVLDLKLYLEYRYACETENFDIPRNQRLFSGNTEECRLNSRLDSYTYKKEGIDIYVSSVGTERPFKYYFKIDNYYFEISTSLLYSGDIYSELPLNGFHSKEEYVNAKEHFQGIEAIHEFAYVWNEESEFIDMLKKIIAESK